jgi:hypothetical protein
VKYTEYLNLTYSGGHNSGCNYLAFTLLTYANLITNGVFSDNCCADRRALESIFGKGVEIKLDPFHSVQRILQSVKKRDMQFDQKKEFTSEVKNLIRARCDYNLKRRQLPTPGPEEICRNIQALLDSEKWTSVITDATKKELRSLMHRHAEKGCLRYIAGYFIWFL